MSDVKQETIDMEGLTLASPLIVERMECSDVTEGEIPAMISIGERMIRMCVKLGGVGLAAPQVGLPKRMFVWVRAEDIGNTDRFQIVFNPKYFKEGKETRMLEGCLSYGEDHFIVKRWKRIIARYDTVKNGKIIHITEHFSERRAIIFQHETDHINGITAALKGERLDEQKNKDFVERIHSDNERRGIRRTPSGTTDANIRTDGTGTAGSAATSFTPNQ
jgi:peptide deformylase